jgi:hypothetical protein
MRADSATQSCFETLLAATAAGDYSRFVSVGDQAFRDGITPEMFHGVSDGLAPRVRSGCTPTYLGQLRQGEGQVSLWQLTFADGGDDALARMSMAHGKVDGFLVTQPFS